MVRTWDLNAPMGLDGRCTYQCKREPAVRPVFPVKPGVVVIRKKLEPLREGEQRWLLPSGGLLNYQSLRGDTEGQWKIQTLSSEDVAAARNYTGPRVLEPLVWEDEVRVQAAEPQSQLCRTVGSSDGSEERGAAPLCVDVVSMINQPSAPPMPCNLKTYRDADGAIFVISTRSRKWGVKV